MVFFTSDELINRLKRKRVTTSSGFLKQNFPKIFEVLGDQIKEDLSLHSYDVYSRGKWYVHFSFESDTIVINTSAEKNQTASTIKDYFPYHRFIDSELKMFLGLIASHM